MKREDINKYIIKMVWMNVAVNLMDVEALKEDKNLTGEEIDFLSNLMFYPNNEIIKGKNGKDLSVEPVGVAVYDFYYGAKMLSGNSIDCTMKTKMEMAKSIFGKFNNPYTYSQLF